MENTIQNGCEQDTSDRSGDLAASLGLMKRIAKLQLLTDHDRMEGGDETNMKRAITGVSLVLCNGAQTDLLK